MRYQLVHLNKVQITVLTVWALVMVSLPIVDWPSGWAAMIGAITVGVGVSAGLIAFLLWDEWGTAAALRTVGSVFALSWAAEAIGSRTGYPFGDYSYTSTLQPQIFDVPVQIPLGWMMMIPPSWAVAQVITDRINPRWKFPAFVGLSALAMTAWDLFLDPMMVTWEIWRWDSPGSYFNIPLTNYLGWLLTSALITTIIRPEKLPVVPLIIVYTTMWLLKSAGLGFFWGLPGAAVTGFLGMGCITILSWRSINRSG